MAREPIQTLSAMMVGAVLPCFRGDVMEIRIGDVEMISNEATSAYLDLLLCDNRHIVANDGSLTDPDASVWMLGEDENFSIARARRMPVAECRAFDIHGSQSFHPHWHVKLGFLRADESEMCKDRSQRKFVFMTF